MDKLLDASEEIPGLLADGLPDLIAGLGMLMPVATASLAAVGMAASVIALNQLRKFCEKCVQMKWFRPHGEDAEALAPQREARDSATTVTDPVEIVTEIAGSFDEPASELSTVSTSELSSTASIRVVDEADDKKKRRLLERPELFSLMILVTLILISLAIFLLCIYHHQQKRITAARESLDVIVVEV